MMNWLAVDTAMNACGVAVQRADGHVFPKIELMERGQAERLMPMILEVCDEAGVALTDIDAYAVANGPGTFTGLRVGLATVRALAQASGKPAIGIGTFDAFTRAHIEEGAPVCIIIETKRSDFYVRAPGHDDACMDPDTLASIIQPNWVLIGDAVDRAVAELALGNKAIPASSVPLNALVACAKARTPDTILPEPVYLRGADVSTAKRKPAQIV